MKIEKVSRIDAARVETEEGIFLRMEIDGFEGMYLWYVPKEDDSGFSLLFGGLAAELEAAYRKTLQ